MLRAFYPGLATPRCREAYPNGYADISRFYWPTSTALILLRAVSPAGFWQSSNETQRQRFTAAILHCNNCKRGSCITIWFSGILQLKEDRLGNNGPRRYRSDSRLPLINTASVPFERFVQFFMRRWNMVFARCQLIRFSWPATRFAVDVFYEADFVCCAFHFNSARLALRRGTRELFFFPIELLTRQDESSCGPSGRLEQNGSVQVHLYEISYTALCIFNMDPALLGAVAGIRNLFETCFIKWLRVASGFVIVKSCFWGDRDESFWCDFLVRFYSFYLFVLRYGRFWF